MAKKIVIVEDNTALAEIYKTRLELVGYACFTAYDGEQALATIEHEIPDLVLLDLMVPKIAGDQILTRMRQSTWGKDIKVYIISNLNEADAPAGLRDLGIEGYAVKANLTNDQLDRTVDSILKDVGHSDDVSLEGPSEPIQPTTQDIPVAAPPPDNTGAAPTMQMPPQPSIMGGPPPPPPDPGVPEPPQPPAPPAPPPTTPSSVVSVGTPILTH
jgi:CheY-like chemotaxis protein